MAYRSYLDDVYNVPDYLEEDAEQRTRLTKPGAQPGKQAAPPDDDAVDYTYPGTSSTLGYEMHPGQWPPSPAAAATPPPYQMQPGQWPSTTPPPTGNHWDPNAPPDPLAGTWDENGVYHPVYNPTNDPEIAQRELDALIAAGPRTAAKKYGTGWVDPGFTGWEQFFTGGGNGTNPTFNGNYQGYFDAMFPGSTIDYNAFVAAEPRLLSAGIKVLRNASGQINGKIQLPNGQIVDVGQDFGPSGGNAKQWLVEGGGGGDEDGGASGPPIDPNSPLLAPYGRAFTPPPAAPAFRDAPRFKFHEFDAPGEFKAPDKEAMLNDPGYKFRMEEANTAYENSAAARGNSLSGGALRDLLKYNQNLASQEYGNVYDRRASEYDRMYRGLLADYTADFQTAAAEYAPTLSEWQIQSGQYATDEDQAYERAWQQYINDQNTYYKNQQNAYDRLYGTGSLGGAFI